MIIIFDSLYAGHVDAGSLQLPVSQQEFHHNLVESRRILDVGQVAGVLDDDILRPRYLPVHPLADLWRRQAIVFATHDQGRHCDGRDVQCLRL